MKLFETDWYRSVLDLTPAPILVERDERIVYVNQSYCSLLGYSGAGSLVDRHISAVIAPVDRPRLTQFARERATAGRPPTMYPFAAQTREGRSRPVYANVAAAFIAGECFITSLLIPIDQAKRDDAAPIPKLSPRERMVFDLLIRGHRQKEIALMLGVSPKTVTTLRGRLMRKLGLTDSWELFHFAKRLADTPQATS